MLLVNKITFLFTNILGGSMVDHNKNLEFTLLSIKDANPLVFTVCILSFMNI